LRPLGATLRDVPLTPARVLEALDAATGGDDGQVVAAGRP
jgi:hypothetical protein